MANAAERPWLGSYPAGVPAEIDSNAYASVAALIDASCDKFRQLPAFENLGVSLSFDDVDRLSQDFASYLQNVVGLNQGDRVALMMPNLLQYPVALFGILRGGFVCTNINPLYTARELEHQLNDSGARAIVILENFCATLQPVLPRTKLETVIVASVGDLAPWPKALMVNFVIRRIKKMVPAWDIPGTVPFRTALARGKAQAYHRVELGHADMAFLQYTGGTTGSSKGATLLHGSVVANLLQLRAWINPWISPGEEVVVTPLPMYHIYALIVCLIFFSVGGKNVFITNPRDLPAFVKELGRHRFTALMGVNTLYNALLATPGFSDLDFSSLRAALVGAAATQQAVADRWHKLTGVPLSEGYGLTEASPAVSANRVDAGFTNSVGMPLPSTEISLRDEDGHEVPSGSPGELCVRGPQVMAGYWQRPEETAKVMTADGFLKTGDIATLADDGLLRIVDRKKDMILVSGFNVYPNEIEAVVALHPGVAEVACIGVPDARSGESVKIFVVRRDAALSAEALRDYCRSQLTGYKVPQQVEFRDSLPKTPVGKILRKDLRQT